MASEEKRRSNEPVPVVPLVAFLPGYDWGNDKTFRRLSEHLDHRSIEYAKVRAYMPRSTFKASMSKICPGLVGKSAATTGARLAKRPEVEQLRKYLAKLYIRMTTVADHISVKKQEIIAGLETMFRIAVDKGDIVNVVKISDKLLKLNHSLDEVEPTLDGVVESEEDIDRMLDEVLRESGKGKATDGDDNPNPEVLG